jgi:hypothetical protein
LQRLVWPLGVVVRGIRGKHPAEVPLAEDQHPVGQLGPHRQHEAFGEAVRLRTTRRDLDHLDTGIRQHRVKRVRELSARSRTRNRNRATCSPSSMTKLRACGGVAGSRGRAGWPWRSGTAGPGGAAAARRWGAPFGRAVEAGEAAPRTSPGVRIMGCDREPAPQFQRHGPSGRAGRAGGTRAVGPVRGGAEAPTHRPDRATDGGVAGQRDRQHHSWRRRTRCAGSAAWTTPRRRGR